MNARDFSAENLELPENNMFCLIDANRGIYIPQMFAKSWGCVCVSGITGEEIDILLAGPGSTDYWEVWDECVNQIEFLFDGHLHTLYEENDLFAVPVK